jgi:hypothetical protein
MTSRTITARQTTLTGRTGGADFTDGVATVDDATTAGKRAIEFAKRQGWSVSGGIATAVDLTNADGEPVARWTTAELEAYLDAHRVAFPDGATDEEMRDAVRDAYETKAQGGSGANASAGHDSETIPPQGAPLVSNPAKPDDEDANAGWSTPTAANVTDDVAPVFTLQPSASSKVEGNTATYTVTVTGTPTPSLQWQRQALGAGDYVDIDGATDDEYTTPALTVEDNHNDRYRCRAENSDGATYSNAVQQAVTAA